MATASEKGTGEECSHMGVPRGGRGMFVSGRGLAQGLQSLSSPIPIGGECLWPSFGCNTCTSHPWAEEEVGRRAANQGEGSRMQKDPGPDGRHLLRMVLWTF